MFWKEISAKKLIFMQKRAGSDRIKVLAQMKKDGGQLRFVQGTSEVPAGYTKAFIAGF